MVHSPHALQCVLLTASGFYWKILRLAVVTGTHHSFIAHLTRSVFAFRFTLTLPASSNLHHRISTPHTIFHIPILHPAFPHVSSCGHSLLLTSIATYLLLTLPLRLPSSCLLSSSSDVTYLSSILLLPSHTIRAPVPVVPPTLIPFLKLLPSLLFLLPRASSFILPFFLVSGPTRVLHQLTVVNCRHIEA